MTHRWWLLAIVFVQVALALCFRTGLLGSDDMTAAFGGKRLLSVFDMTQAFTNQPMSMRVGMALPLGILQWFVATTTALWLFPLLVSLAMAPLSYRLARQLELSREYALLGAAAITLMPACIFNATVALTEIPLLVLSLFALTRMNYAIAAWDAGERARAYRASAWCGLALGYLFTIKVSAVFLGMTIGAYGVVDGCRKKQFPGWLVAVVVAGAFVSSLEMAMWWKMTDNAFYRLDMVQQTMVRVKQQAVEIYEHKGWSEVALNLARYRRDFLDDRAQYGNIFVLVLAAAIAACLLVRGRRWFLILYGAPQLYYFGYILVAGPSVQPRYGIQLLPFVLLGTLLLVAQRRWARPRLVFGITALLLTQAIVLGLDARSSQYRRQNMDVPRYAHAKLRPLVGETPVCVDPRMVSVFYTLSDFELPLPNQLRQYPDQKYFKVAFREMRRHDNIAGIYPWTTTGLEVVDGFVLLDARLLSWYRRRMEFPPHLTEFPREWLLVDQVASADRDSLHGMVVLGRADTQVEEIPGRLGCDSAWFYRARKSPTWDAIPTDAVDAAPRSLIALGRGSTTRPAFQLDPAVRSGGQDEFLTLEVPMRCESEKSRKPIAIPVVYLFADGEVVASLRMQALFDEGKTTSVRIPVRIPAAHAGAPIDGMAVALMVREPARITLGTPRLFRQHPSAAALEQLRRYDTVPVSTQDVVTLATATSTDSASE